MKEFVSGREDGRWEPVTMKLAERGPYGGEVGSRDPQAHDTAINGDPFHGLS